jgi:hypothetical protein
MLPWAFARLQAFASKTATRIAAEATKPTTLGPEKHHRNGTNWTAPPRLPFHTLNQVADKPEGLLPASPSCLPKQACAYRTPL